jgi:hypothetical protein
MISSYCIPFRLVRVAAAAPSALAACLLSVPPAAGREATTPAQQLTGQFGRSVLPAQPSRLRWDAPGGLFWAQGEATRGNPEPSPVTESGFERGAIALGARRELTLLPHLSWSVAPQLRVETAGDTNGLPTAPAINGMVEQELALSLPGQTRIAATIGLHDWIAAAGLGGPPTGAAPTLRAKAMVAMQGQVVGAPVRTEFQVTTIRTVAADHGLDRPPSCELGLAVRWAGGPPLRLAGSCPGEATHRVTLGISASF